MTSDWHTNRSATVRVPLQRPDLPRLVDVQRYYERSEQARWYSNGGPCVSLLEDRITTALEAEAFAVANCTVGLVLALRATTIARRTSGRRYVVCPSYTFSATAGAVVSAGFEPLFVDVDPVNWQPDPAQIDLALAQYGTDVAAVVTTSTFGCPPPIEVRVHWETSCAAAGVPLVVDSAAGFGAQDADGRLLGRQGDAEVFSFHATKPFAVGEGGLVTTTDPEVAELLRTMRNFGFDSERRVVGEGTNAKLSEIQAAVALVVWDRFGDVLDARRARGGWLCDALSPSDFVFQPLVASGTWPLTSVLVPASSRARIEQQAFEEGVELRRYYDRPLHRESPYEHGSAVGTLPVTLELAQRTLTLPMANDLDADELVRVVHAVTGRAPEPTLVDELHVVTEGVWDSMALSSGKRDRSLVLGISTPGVSPDSVMWRLVQHGREGDDASFFFAEFAAPEGCAVEDEEAWATANPALDDFLHRDALRSTLRTTREAAFRRYRLGQWAGQVGGWIDWSAWASRAALVDVQPRTRVVLGFDGSASGDSTALVGCTVTDPHLFVLGVWANPGRLSWRVPRAEVSEVVEAAFARYEVVELAVDPWGWRSEIETWSARWPGRVVEFNTAAAQRMGPATDRLFQAVAEGGITHDGDERLAAHIAHAVAKATPHGDVVTKDKRMSTRKIDAAIAAIIAADRAAYNAVNARPNRTVAFL